MAVHAGLSALHAAAGVGWVDDGLTTDTLTYCVWQGAMCAAGQTGSILVSSHPCLCCGRSMHSRHDLWAQLRACAWHEEATCRTRHAAAQGVAAQGTPSVGQQPARCVACGWYKPQANGSDTASMPYACCPSVAQHMPTRACPSGHLSFNLTYPATEISDSIQHAVFWYAINIEVRRAAGLHQQPSVRQCALRWSGTLRAV